MSFSSRKNSILPHIISLLVSVIIATAMWYTVSVRDRIEAQFEVTINYVGIPKNLIVTDGLINKVTVRMRGPQTLLRGVENQRLNQKIDLSMIKKGVTIVPLSTERLAAYYRAFEVLDVQPPRIVVNADLVVERSVPVQPVITSSLRSGVLTVENVVVTPPQVILTGPESVVSEISSLRLPVIVDPKAAGMSVDQTLPLDSPGLVSVNPRTVRVTYTITSGRVEVTRNYKVQITSERPSRYTVEPAEIPLTVEVPEALVKSTSYLTSLKVNASPPVDLEPGVPAEVELHYMIPDGMIVRNRPKTVLMTLKPDKNAVKAHKESGKTHKKDSGRDSSKDGSREDRHAKP